MPTVRLVLWLALGALLGCDTNALIKPGDWEAEGMISAVHGDNDVSDRNAIEVDALLNNAITSGFQIGPLFVFEASDLDTRQGDDVDRIAYLFGPNFRFTLPGTESVLPYVDAAAGTGYLDADVRSSNGNRANGTDSTLFLQGGVGIRVFLSEHAALNFALRYRWVDIDDELGGDQQDYGGFGGFSVFF